MAILTPLAKRVYSDAFRPTPSEDEERDSGYKTALETGWNLPGLSIELEPHDPAVIARVILAIFSDDVDCDLPAEMGRRALLWASRHGRADVVDMLLRRKDIDDMNCWFDFNLKPLMLATIHGHAAVVDLLLGKGADPEYGEFIWKYRTALMVAAGYGYTEIVRQLLDHGADARAVDGMTTLMYAALEDSPGAVDIIRTLLDAGTELDAVQSSNGYTALMWAAREGHISAVTFLLLKGANTEVESVGSTALILAAKNGHASIVQVLLQPIFCGLYISAAIEANNGWGTSLLEAALEGHSGVVKVLLENGASTSAVTRYGETALQVACRRGHMEIVKMLSSLDKKQKSHE
jgi:ankyrin repeat protein